MYFTLSSHLNLVAQGLHRQNIMGLPKRKQMPACTFSFLFIYDCVSSMLHLENIRLQLAWEGEARPSKPGSDASLQMVIFRSRRLL